MKKILIDGISDEQFQRALSLICVSKYRDKNSLREYVCARVGRDISERVSLDELMDKDIPRNLLPLKRNLRDEEIMGAYQTLFNKQPEECLFADASTGAIDVAYALLCYACDK